jgi:hypothetical protein
VVHGAIVAWRLTDDRWPTPFPKAMTVPAAVLGGTGPAFRDVFRCEPSPRRPGTEPRFEVPVAVFMTLAPAATLLDRMPASISSVLRLHGVDDTIIASELAAMSDHRIAPTDNRSIVGVMNEFGIVGERMFGAVHGDLPALSMRISTMIVRPLMKGTGSPDRELAAVVAADEQPQPLSNVIQFPGSHRPDPVFASVTRPSATGRIFQLKVALQNIKPPVWRRILVDASSTLDQTTTGGRRPSTSGASASTRS